MFKSIIFTVLLLLSTACSGAYVSVKPIKSAILPVIEDIVDEKKGDEPQTRQVVYIPKHKERKIAEIKLGIHTPDGDKETTIDIRKDYRGYIAEAPVYQEKKFSAAIALSRSKEHKLMLGVKLSWKF